jgi:hypothetical protein
MPCLAVREFDCILCHRHFTLLTQDFILPWTLICDECLVELWELEGDALAEYLAARLGMKTAGLTQSPPLHPPRRGGQRGGSDQSQGHRFEQKIMPHLKSLKQRWTTVQEAIRDRELGRQAFGQAGGDVAG